MEPVESAQQVGYRILPDDYYLPDLGLDAGEEQALGFAIAARSWARGRAEAIAKLGNRSPRRARRGRDRRRTGPAPTGCRVALPGGARAHP